MTDTFKYDDPSEIERPTLGEVQEMDEMGEGFCTACGETQGGCEPDAAEYTCESCGAKQVYGAAELVMMDLVK